MAARKKYGKRKAHKATKSRKGSRRRGGKGLKKIIKALIGLSQETKGGSHAFSDSLGAVNNAAFDLDIVPVGIDAGAIQVSQGTGVGGRIGNKITTVSSVIKGQIYPTPYNGVSNTAPMPYLVQMYLFYDKTQPNLIPDPRTDFYQVNNADQAMTGTLQDLDFPINTDKYKVFVKRVYKVGFAENAASGAQNFPQFYSNNDFKLVNRFSINIKKYMPKHVKFNDTSTDPTTRGLYLMFNVIQATGLNPSATTLAVGFNIVNVAKWKDA